MVELYALAGLKRAVHGIGVLGLDADDFHSRAHLLHIRGDATDESAATDRHEDGIQRVGMLLEDFEADGALPGNHLRVVVGCTNVSLRLVAISRAWA